MSVPRRIRSASPEPSPADPALPPVAVAVDVVPLAIHEERLHAAVIPVDCPSGAAPFAFPGRRVRPGESLDIAARRCLESRLDPTTFFLEQLYAFGEPGRDPGSPVVSVAYLALLARPACGSDLRWTAWEDLPTLAYDHRAVAFKALERLRGKLSYTNIAFALQDDPFTLSELQSVYETILGTSLDRRNFRKKVLSLRMVKPIGRVRRGPHRPAELFRFAQRRLVPLQTLFPAKGRAPRLPPERGGSS